MEFLHSWKESEGHHVFKFHMAFHVVEQASAKGNPRAYWTYADEAENRLMGFVAKALHGGRTFYTRFLQRVLPENL
eukprot:5461262-Pyramimonas_sp.AAC.1